MVPNVPAPLSAGERAERLVPGMPTRYIQSNDLYDIALWGPRDFGFAAWVIKTAKAPGPGEHGSAGICVYIPPVISASERSGDRRVGGQGAVDMHQSHRLPPVILASP